MKRLIFFGYAVSAVALLLFSYTQTDLNLTLSRAGFVREAQKAFQYVGFYQRPVATAIYIGILAVLFSSYLALLKDLKGNVAGFGYVWRIIVLTTVILVFSYPAALSYDFFNYLFTAKTVLVYRQNPYLVTPLMFSGIDPWTNFMRWTHLSSAYTPLWIAMSLIPFALGLGVFIAVMFSMKFMIAGFYLLACWALGRQVKSPFALAVFALNPLLILETLVSGHNDIVMAAFVLISILYSSKNALTSWFFLALSVAAKFMTIVLIPFWFLKKKPVWMLAAMLAGLAIVLTRREFLPWYWVWILPFVALTNENPRIVRFSTAVSLGLALSYAPFLYFGEYSPLSQLMKTTSIWSGVLLGGILALFPVEVRRNGRGARLR